ncbi:SDR family oxidoreductase [Deltaproteobacteria bacterium OttesenSCG-928-K17]|nr:SDR family oxidoreductase [Deltaproteobacteria bacterium OttesenSCG-928-K17]
MSRTCLITGAGGALGAALAQAFAAEGYGLILCGRSLDKLKAASENLRGQARLEYAVCDLAAPESIEIIGAAADSLGGADIIINNAAVQGPIGPFAENDFCEWEKALTIDFIRPAALIQRLLPLMMKKGWGRIINIAGGGASQVRPFFSAYASAKTALVRFSETLAAELKPFGITVNSVSPGAMRSAMTEEINARADKAGPGEALAAQKLLADGGRPPENAAALCLFLCRPQADGISGKMISAVWDDYGNWPEHLPELDEGGLYTLRRLTARDKGYTWGDK